MANNAKNYPPELEMLLADLRRERLNREHLKGNALEDNKVRIHEILEQINVVRKMQTGKEFICVSEYQNLDSLMDAVLDAWNSLKVNQSNLSKQQ